MCAGTLTSTVISFFCLLAKADCSCDPSSASLPDNEESEDTSSSAANMLGLCKHYVKACIGVHEELQVNWQSGGKCTYLDGFAIFLLIFK